MEAAIQTVVTVFVKSAKGKESLGGKDFNNLVKNHLKNILTDTDSSEAVKNMRQGLDANHDGKVGFEEYMKLVGYLATSLSQQRSVPCEAPVENAAAAAVVAAEPESAEPTAEKEEEKAAVVEEEPQAEVVVVAAAAEEEVKEEGKVEAKEEEEKAEEAEKVEEAVEEVVEVAAAPVAEEEEKKTEVEGEKQEEAS